MPILERMGKAVPLSLAQARWLEEEAERTGIAEAELIRQAIKRLMAGPPAEFRPERYGLKRPPLAEYLKRGDWPPPSEDVLKTFKLDLPQILWLREESKRLGVSHKELLCQAVERFQSGPPAELPSDPRFLWRRKDWLYTVTASQSLERKWERYRARQANASPIG